MDLVVSNQMLITDLVKLMIRARYEKYLSAKTKENNFMALFICILEGPTASRASPIIAISDPILVAMLRERIWERMANTAASGIHIAVSNTTGQVLRADEEEEIL